MKKTFTAAIVTIKKPSRMSPKGRHHIGRWLRKQARLLERYGNCYTEGTFVARYLYR